MEKEIRLFILFVSLAFLAFFLILPLSQKVQNIKIEVQALKEEAESLDQHLQKMKATYEEITKNETFSLIKTAIPEKPDFSDLASFIYQKATQQGLLSSGVSFSGQSSGSTGSGAKRLQISFSLTGNYQSFKNFLKELELSQRHFKVKKLNLSPKKENLEAQMTVEVLHY
jgi:Tfp pilus assembly protein PilO